MRTLAVVGTAGGVGTTTLAALAFAAARSRPGGAPLLYARPGAGLPARAGGDEVASVTGEQVIWDAGVRTPAGAAELVRTGGCSVVVAAPATPLGVADAVEVLDALRELGDGAAGTTVVLTQVTRGTGPGSLRALGGLGVPLLRVPHDRRLALPGPVPEVDRLGRRRRAAVRAWQERALAVLAG